VKKFFNFIAPFLIAVLIFFGITFFLNREAGKGALRVTSRPQSKVYLENKLIGTTPFCACDLTQMLAIGNYTIKLVPLDVNIRPFEERIAINKYTLTVVDRTFADNGGSDGSIISLVSLGDEKDAQILVVSFPDKANVFLDGNPVGITPLLLNKVSESDHDLRLTLNGYQDKTLKIKTALGFQLNALVFLGIKPDLSNPIEASNSAAPVTTSVVILDTPTGFLRVRETNSVYSAEIGQVKPGESYQLVGEKDNWLEIKLSSPEAKLGWISSQYAIKK
jgi:hypothetical protein